MSKKTLINGYVSSDNIFKLFLQQTVGKINRYRNYNIKLRKYYSRYYLENKRN
jgi:hypothetical protein